MHLVNTIFKLFDSCLNFPASGNIEKIGGGNFVKIVHFNQPVLGPKFQLRPYTSEDRNGSVSVSVSRKQRRVVLRMLRRRLRDLKAIPISRTATLLWLQVQRKLIMVSLAVGNSWTVTAMESDSSSRMST